MAWRGVAWARRGEGTDNRRRRRRRGRRVRGRRKEAMGVAVCVWCWWWGGDMAAARLVVLLLSGHPRPLPLRCVLLLCICPLHQPPCDGPASGRWRLASPAASALCLRGAGPIDALSGMAWRRGPCRPCSAFTSASRDAAVGEGWAPAVGAAAEEAVGKSGPFLGLLRPARTERGW